MPPEEQPGRPLPGDATPRRTLDEKLAAAQSRQSKKRRRVAVAAGMAVAAVAAAGGGVYLVAELGRAREQLQQVGEALSAGVVTEIQPEAAAPAPAVDAAVVDAPAVETVADAAPVVAETVDESAAVAAESAPAETVAVETVEEETPVVEVVAEPVAETVADVPPALAEWLARAEVARVENRPQKEVAALQKILELDPARADARTRLQELQAQMAQEKFAAAVESAQEALDTGDLPAAAQLIASAQSIFPSHEALLPLQNQLQSALAAREFTAVMALGRQAGRQDDWQTARAHFARARAIKPNDSGAVDGLNRAQEVVAAGRKIADYLAAPHRLADRRVVDAAAEYLAEVAPVAEHSSKLQASRAELTAAVDAYLTEVEVVVVSDGKSDIQVRGEGQVGKTARRAIPLRPGARVFECNRRGYKSKLVTLDIPPGAAGPFEVTVICDEKI